MIYTCLAVAFAIGACTASVGVAPTPARTTDEPTSVASSPVTSDPMDAPELALLPPSEEGADADLRGTLRLVGPCLIVVDENETTWLTVWPSSARWDAGSKSITVDSVTLMSGEVGLLGGGEGYIERATLDRYEWVQRPNLRCLPARVWFVHTVRTADE